MAINFRDQIGDRPMFRLPGVDPRNPITERGTVPAAQPLVPPGSIVLPKRMEASRPVQIAALPEPTVSQLSSESTVAQPLKVNTRDFAVGLSRPDAGEVEGEEKEVTDSQREDVTNAIITASNKAAGATVTTSPGFTPSIHNIVYGSCPKCKDKKSPCGCDK